MITKIILYVRHLLGLNKASVHLPNAKKAFDMASVASYNILMNTVKTDLNRAINGGYFSCSIDLVNSDKTLIRKIRDDMHNLGYKASLTQSKYPAYINLTLSWDSMSIDELMRTTYE